MNVVLPPFRAWKRLVSWHELRPRCLVFGERKSVVPSIRSQSTVRSPRLQTHLIFACWLALCASFARADVVTRTISPGITFTQEMTSGEAPRIVNILRVDLKAPGVKVRCGQAQDAVTLNGPAKGRERLHSLTARNGALAAVNADYFPYTGDPVGLEIRDGELIGEPLEYRACLGIGQSGIRMDVLLFLGVMTAADGTTLSLDGINRVPHNGETVVLTPTYGATPALEAPATVVELGGVALPVRLSQDIHGAVVSVSQLPTGQHLPACPPGGTLLVAAGSAANSLMAHARVGDSVHFRFDLAPNTPAPLRGRYAARAGFARSSAFRPSWTDVEQAVGGGPWLVRNGQVMVDYEAENFPKASFVDSRHARTAAGVTADGKLLLVTVDGRQAWSRGVSLPELADLMQRLGAVNAMNLDGGGSTTMVVGGGVVNAPSDGRERAIADSLLVYGAPAETADATVSLQVRCNTPDTGGIPVGEAVTFLVTDTDGNPLPGDRNVIWGTGDGLGFISQRGVFTSYHTGAGTITAWVGGRQLSFPVRVVGGLPAVLKVTLGPVANNPPDRSQLTVLVLDRFGNPVAGQKVTATFDGEVETPLVTDSNGRATSEIVWNAEPGHRTLTVSAGNAPPIILKR